VRDEDAGAVELLLRERRPDRLFGLRVEVPGRLVQKENARPSDERAGNRDPLDLTA